MHQLLELMNVAELQSRTTVAKQRSQTAISIRERCENIPSGWRKGYDWGGAIGKKIVWLFSPKKNLR